MAEVKHCPECGAALSAGAPDQPCPACLMKLGLESWSSQEGRTPPDQTPTTPWSSRFEPIAPEELQPLFPNLQILDLLGAGGMGAVYKARQPHLDRYVALKILPPQLGDDPAFEERFTREARALARLSHPNIVGVYDYGVASEGTGGSGPADEKNMGPSSTADGTSRYCYFLMEYVDGLNVRQLIRQQTLSPEEALAIVPQICEALQFAHDEGIVHRDIKPENILIDKKGRVKIADFGLAKLVDPHLARPDSPDAPPPELTLTGTGQVMGTLHYMAPEQTKSSHLVDHRADIFSLGVVFYEMLTGELPIGRFEPPSRKAQVDIRLDEVVLRALENEPERRYQTASAVKTDLETICGLPKAAAHRIFGSEYRSQTSLFGVPLVHIAFGLDPRTGRSRTAKGIIAIGDKAVGVMAFGGVAIGGIAVGGASCGLVALGGAALGLLAAFAGVAVGGMSFGGMSIGAVAVGGKAIGIVAGGASAWGAYVATGSVQDPEALRIFQHIPWARNWDTWMAGFGVGMPAFAGLVFVVSWLVLHRQGRQHGGDADGRGGNHHRPGSAGGIGTQHHSLVASALRQLRAPAIMLTATAVIKVVMGALLFLSSLPITLRTDTRELASALMMAVIGIAMTAGGRLILRLESYVGAFVVGGLGLAPLVTPALADVPLGPWALDLLSVPVGIWLMLVLARPDVGAAFAHTQSPNTRVAPLHRSGRTADSGSARQADSDSPSPDNERRQSSEESRNPSDRPAASQDLWEMIAELARAWLAYVLVMFLAGSLAMGLAGVWEYGIRGDLQSFPVAEDGVPGWARPVAVALSALLVVIGASGLFSFFRHWMASEYWGGPPVFSITSALQKVTHQTAGRLAILLIALLIGYLAFKLLAPDVSDAVWGVVLVIGLLGFLIDALRHPGKLKGLRAAFPLLAGLTALLVYLIAQPQELLERLYQITGGSPSQDDATVLRLLLGAVAAWLLWQMYQVHRKISALRDREPDGR